MYSLHHALDLCLCNHFLLQLFDLATRILRCLCLLSARKRHVCQRTVTKAHLYASQCVHSGLCSFRKRLKCLIHTASIQRVFNFAVFSQLRGYRSDCKVSFCEDQSIFIIELHTSTQRQLTLRPTNQHSPKQVTA